MGAPPAFILAAGLGTRLALLTEVLPKRDRCGVRRDPL